MDNLIGQRILVTGAAGFIGSALANFLASKNEVVGLDNLSSGDWQRCSSNIKKVEFDLAKMSDDEFSNLLEGKDILFHLAAVKLHNVDNSDRQIIQSNVLASNRLFAAAGKSGIKRVIFTSSLYANGNLGPKIMKESDRENPSTLYGAAKLFSEKDLAISSHRFGFSYVIPRLFFIYGPKQYTLGGYKSVIVNNFQRKIKNLPMQIYGSGDQVLDYVYIDNCVQAICDVAQSKFEGVIHISSGAGVTIKELIEKMIDISGESKIEYVAPDWTAGTFRVGSNEILKKVTGRAPNVSLNDGLNLTWNSISHEKS